MKKSLLTCLVIALSATTVFAESTEFDLSLKVGLSSLDNNDGWNFKKTTIAADGAYDLGYVIKPRIDFVYINVDEKVGGVDSLWQLAFDGVYELDLSDEYYVDPYLFAGVGYEFVSGERKGFGDKLFLQGGLGIKYPITNMLNLVTEFKALQIFDTSRNDEKNEFAFLIGVNMPFHTQEVVDDHDKDGVLDPSDLCPGTPVGTKVDTNGCPIVKPVVEEVVEEQPEPKVLLDTDHDGVTDDEDICPNTPHGFKVNKVGCGIKKTLEVHFESNLAKLTKNSMVKVRKFAKYMKSLPSVSVKIEGYTDSSGLKRKNQILSQKRAAAVKKALIHYGISASRITAIGKGSLNPIADNTTVAGRAKNRRIEAIIHH